MQRDHTKLLCDISELTGLFADAKSLEVFLQKIVEMASVHMQADVCSIYLFNEDVQELVLKATKGLNPNSIGKVRLKLGEGLTGRTVETRQSICEPKASQAAGYRYFPEIGEEPYESFLAVPILHGQRRIGAMVIQHAQENYFNDDDIKTFRAVTLQLANTIEMAKVLMDLDDPHPLAARPLFAGKPEVIEGKSGSGGMALASAKIFDEKDFRDQDTDKVRRPLGLKDFYAAVEASEKQLEELQTLIEATLSDVPALIFTAQILMLKDKPFLDKMVDLIKGGLYPPEAIKQTVGHYVRMFKNLSSVYLQDKKEDVKDVGRRLLKNLRNEIYDDENYAGHIVIASELFPSDIIKLSSQGVKGFILLRGGSTSHISILARSLQIPLMIADHPALLQLPAETEVLMDAEDGQIYILPSPAVKAEYEKRSRDQMKVRADSQCAPEEIVTKDGTRVDVLANINLLNDLKAAKAFNAKGVGLYRTEFPFIVRSDFPSEEEQFVTYKKLIDGMEGKEITFRTLDIGGDKILSYFDYGKEENPFLGMRSIRFSLRHKEVFRQQLRAILRAGAGADLRIMFPMISSIEEFLEARQELLDCIRGLKDEGIVCHEQPAIGMMAELPAVIEIIEDLAQEADFFSIGTNDFIQYMLAVDRTNAKVADFYIAHHPSILRALKRIVDAAAKAGKEVSVCGDMAHDSRFVIYFLGIGVRKFSLDTSYISHIQKIVMNSTIAGAEKMARQILAENKMNIINRALTGHD